MSGYSEAQNRASQKYQKENCDRISFVVRKGMREVYSQAAAERGYSLAGWIKALMDKEIEQGH